MVVHNTPVTYSVAEAATIRKEFAEGTGDLLCPRCHTRLLISPCFERKHRRLSEIYCGECQRCVIVRLAKEAASG